ncbi:MAG: dephospho-CoA kinase [Enterococcus sp.]|nr:dephospho-CoA kinase [Enterococcus sp.]
MGFVLGLTGGIASGKSTVLQFFKEYHFPIVDGDQIAREIVRVGQPALAALVAHFGQEILLENKELDRKKLGALIFADATKRKELDALLNPFLRKAIYQEVEEKKKQAALTVVDLPLLYEGHYETLMDQVAVVYLPKESQMQRLMQRDNLSKEAAEQRIASQMSIEEKKERADILFDNRGSLAETKQQVTTWLKGQGFL